MGSYELTSTDEVNNINSYTPSPRINDYNNANEEDQLSPIDLVEMSQSTAVPGTYTYTFQYDGIENKGYEGVLHVATDDAVPSPTDALVSSFQHAIKI